MHQFFVCGKLLLCIEPDSQAGAHPPQIYLDREEARRDVFDYIEFCNPKPAWLRKSAISGRVREAIFQTEFQWPQRSASAADMP